LQSSSLLVCLSTLLIVLLGISSLVNIKRDSFPSVEFGEVLITTEYPGASPEDAELNVTNEIEKEIKEVTRIKRDQSWSMENVSIGHIVIDPDEKDQNKVVTELREAVARVTDLPNAAGLWSGWCRSLHESNGIGSWLEIIVCHTAHTFVNSMPLSY